MFRQNKNVGYYQNIISDYGTYLWHTHLYIVNCLLNELNKSRVFVGFV